MIDDVTGENFGVIPFLQALQMAEERGLDLVEVAANADPPVCKIIDYGRFKYEQEKKAREAKRTTRESRHASDMKEVQLSPRIDGHDLGVKAERARGFLREGHPVRLVVRFKGRDLRHPELGMRALHQALEQLGEDAQVDQPPRMEGRQLAALIRMPRSRPAAARPAGPTGPAAEQAVSVAEAPTAPAAQAAAPVAAATG